ncbi:MAG TPA: exodeoxyribonuclease III [Spirochaetota bacterium]|nr:exodeoxyribonuclease III [Spirochaetota bacterium]HOM10535.1 exodeoxyribonuclease III [Spirochaetota bacterium]HPP49863.1 exodeoxyribonuclease III [Spirochaetota bacterium]
MKLKLISWNVNGIRAVYKKGFFQWFVSEKPDILCLQETKATADQFPEELKKTDGYYTYFAEAQKKGYSGVALFSTVQPKKVETGFGIERFDTEGRILIAYYDAFVLYNIYFPNGKASKERLQYKMDFYDAFLVHAEKLRKKGMSIVMCGDVNTAHTEIDLARPKENENVSGFLPEERAWIDTFINKGYTDTFRLFIKEGGHYSWWDYKTKARERNIGWRIDYFFVSNDLVPKVKDAFILDKVEGSDHCPVGIVLEI